MGSQLDMKLGLVLPEGERDMGGKTARWSDYVDDGADGRGYGL